MLIGPPCADAVAFLKPEGITAAKPPPQVVTRPDDDVVVDLLLKLGGIAVVFEEVAVGVAAEAAAKRDDDETDPQPAKASAAVAASATAPYRIDDRESAMLTGLLLGERKAWMGPRRPSPLPLLGSEGMATGSPPEGRRGRGHGSRPPPHRCRLTPPEVSPGGVPLSDADPSRIRLRDHTGPKIGDLRAGVTLESSSVGRWCRSGFSSQMDPQVRGRA
jgi:hypothetical protein